MWIEKIKINKKSPQLLYISLGNWCISQTYDVLGTQDKPLVNFIHIIFDMVIIISI